MRHARRCPGRRTRNIPRSRRDRRTFPGAATPAFPRQRRRSRPAGTLLVPRSRTRRWSSRLAGEGTGPARWSRRAPSWRHICTAAIDPACRRSRAGSPATWPTISGRCWSGCRRRGTTTSRSPMRRSGCTTGSSPGIISSAWPGSCPRDCPRPGWPGSVARPTGWRWCNEPCETAGTGASGRRLRRISARAPAPSYPVLGTGTRPSIGLRSSFTHRGYLDAVTRVREYIIAGDIFQANLSQRLESPAGRRSVAPLPPPARGEPGAVRVPTSSSAAWRWPAPRRSDSCRSRPTARPRPGPSRAPGRAASARSTTPPCRSRLAGEREGPGREPDDRRPAAERPFAGLPSGDACESRSCSRWSSTRPCITSCRPSPGSLQPGKDAADLLAATFPGGSITGAPKVRAMEIIAELEPSRRGIYCGSIGYWSVTGAMDTSIVIRTLVAGGAAGCSARSAAGSWPIPTRNRNTRRPWTRRGR